MSPPKKNILFIINPISGGKQKSTIPSLIDKYLDKSVFNANFSFTEHIGHGAELAEEAAKKDFDILVAVGGDGTINEVAAKAMEYRKVFGIIPLGSGNGLARFLEIPLNSKAAIQLINNYHLTTIDTATLNQKPFFNMAGVGFDAQVSWVFANNNRSRGLKTYIELGLKEATSYEAQHYTLEIDGIAYKREALVISIANSSQYGNNVYISPNSAINDGWLEVCVVKPFPLYKLPVLAYQMIRKKTHQYDMVEIIQGKNIKIYRDKEDALHLDGEAFMMGKEIDIKIVPSSLTIITK